MSPITSNTTSETAFLTKTGSVDSGSGRQFFDRLESLRGIAALVVVFSHARAVLVTPTGWPSQVLFSPWFNGHVAVILFFVLSGYVLGLSLRREKMSFAPAYFRFGWRRVWRIYPAFTFALALTVAYLFLIGPQMHNPLVSQWFSQFYRATPTFNEVYQNFIMKIFGLNCVVWTLRTELIDSLLLPILHLISVRLHAVGKWIFLIFLMTISWVVNTGSTAYLFLFYIGYLIPEIAFIFQKKWVTKRVVVLLAFLSVTILFQSTHLPFWIRIEDYIQGGCSAILIALIVYGRSGQLFGFLDFPFIRFLGKISYSFYLLHFICILAASQILFWALDPGWISAHPLLFFISLSLITIALSTGLASFSYHFIEKPTIAFSKKTLIPQFLRRSDREAMNASL